MKRDISEFVTKCLVCQRVKAEHQVPSGLLGHVVSASSVSIDPKKVEAVIGRGQSQYLRYAVYWDWQDIIGGLLRISPG